MQQPLLELEIADGHLPFLWSKPSLARRYGQAIVLFGLRLLKQQNNRTDVDKGNSRPDREHEKQILTGAM